MEEPELSSAKASKKTSAVAARTKLLALVASCNGLITIVIDPEDARSQPVVT